MWSVFDHKEAYPKYKQKTQEEVPKGYVPHYRLDDSVCLRLNIFFRRFLDFVIRFSAGLHTYLDVDRRC